MPVIALLVALLGVTATGLIAQDAPDEPGRLDITVFVVGEHATLDRPLVIVLNPSWAQSHAVISVEADALDASLLERGLRAAERALSSESLAGSEDVILSVALLQGPTGEAHEAQPSAFRDRAQWAVDYLTPRIEQLRASPTGLRGAPGPNERPRRHWLSGVREHDVPQACAFRREPAVGRLRCLRACLLRSGSARCCWC